MTSTVQGNQRARPIFMKDSFVIPRRRSKPDSGLRAIFRTRLPTFDITSIETGLTISGVPDLNYCCNGIEGWVETKACAYWRITVSPNQVGWIKRRIRHGGRVFVAVRRTRYELWLYQGADIERLRTERLDKVPAIGRWSGGPRYWDWNAIAKLLLK